MTYRRELFVCELMVTDVVDLGVKVGHDLLRAPAVNLEFEVSDLIEVLTAWGHLGGG